MTFKHILPIFLCGIIFSMLPQTSLCAAPSQAPEEFFAVQEFLKAEKVRGVKQVITIDMARLGASLHKNATIAVIAPFVSFAEKAPDALAEEYDASKTVFLTLGGKVPAGKLPVVALLKSKYKPQDVLAEMEKDQMVLLIGKIRQPRAKLGKAKAKSGSADTRQFVFEVERAYPMTDIIAPETGNETGDKAEDKADDAADGAPVEKDEAEEVEEPEEKAEEKAEEPKDKTPPADEKKKAPEPAPTPVQKNADGSDDWM